MIAAALRVKNEGRFLARCLRAIVGRCDAIVVFDDHSTDSTREIAAEFGAVVICSPFDSLNEARDRNYLLAETRKLKPDWILLPDGDEEFSPAALAAIEHAAQQRRRSGIWQGLSFRIVYLWDNEDTVRMDGVYSRMFAVRAFRDDWLCRFASGNAAGFHCGALQTPNPREGRNIDLPIWHYGYIDAALRRQKYDFYRLHDPVNRLEDDYQHIIQGDPGGPASGATLKHAGPLKLQKRGIQ